MAVVAGRTVVDDSMMDERLIRWEFYSIGGRRVLRQGRGVGESAHAASGRTPQCFHGAGREEGWEERGGMGGERRDGRREEGC